MKWHDNPITWAVIFAVPVILMELFPVLRVPVLALFGVTVFTALILKLLPERMKVTREGIWFDYQGERVCWLWWWERYSGVGSGKYMAPGLSIWRMNSLKEVEDFARAKRRTMEILFKARHYEE